MPLLMNALLFQLGWFACVLSAAAHVPWAGSTLALLILLWHLTIGPARRGEWLLIGAAALVGIIVDSALARMGWLAFSSGVVVEGISAHWMVALWMIFAATLHHSLSWLRTRLGLACVLGALTGPLSYWAGDRLGALTMAPLDHGMAAVSVAWAIALPALLHTANWIERRAAESSVMRPVVRGGRV